MVNSAFGNARRLGDVRDREVAVNTCSRMPPPRQHVLLRVSANGGRKPWLLTFSKRR
jgi:hypothetical protein